MTNRDADLGLSKALSAHAKWRWREGMRWVLPGTELSGRYRDLILDPEALPDLDDPATAGVLLDMVWEFSPDALIEPEVAQGMVAISHFGPGGESPFSPSSPVPSVRPFNRGES